MYQATLPPVSNRATWAETFALIDDVTREPFDLTGVTAIVFEVQDPGCGTVLSAALGSGITIEEDDEGSYISIRFETSSMRVLSAKSYNFGLVITKDEDDIEIILGSVPVLDGYVS